MDIREILRDRRIELGVSQAELARHCGFAHKSSVSLLESDRREWKFKDIVKACEMLKLEMDIKDYQGNFSHKFV